MGELIGFPKSPDKKQHLNLDQLIFVLNTTGKIVETITGNKQGENYRMHFANVSKYTDEQLIELINMATEKDIQKMPMFFQAVIEVSRTRSFYPKKKEE